MHCLATFSYSLYTSPSMLQSRITILPSSSLFSFSLYFASYFKFFNLFISILLQLFALSQHLLGCSLPLLLQTHAINRPLPIVSFLQLPHFCSRGLSLSSNTHSLHLFHLSLTHCIPYSFPFHDPDTITTLITSSFSTSFHTF